MIMAYSVGGWRNRVPGHTRRMVENATWSIKWNGTVLISPPSPPVPKPSAEDLVLKAERDEEERQRDIFFNKMDYMLANFNKRFLRVGAEDLMRDPHKYTRYWQDIAQIPGGKMRVIEARVCYNEPFKEEAEQIAKINLIMKLENACGNYGANYGFRVEKDAKGDVLVMDSVPVLLDHGI